MSVTIFGALNRANLTNLIVHFIRKVYLAVHNILAHQQDFFTGIGIATSWDDNSGSGLTQRFLVVLQHKLPVLVWGHNLQIKPKFQIEYVARSEMLQIYIPNFIR